tara:strand:+ start:543 stop:797 length:255 start_codon:yes stop_codon:yes gene_type:complete
MSQINITTNKNTVTVNGETRVVKISTAGPQGPAGTSGGGGSAGGLNFDLSGKVDDAVLYYHAASDTIKADNTTTKLTLVDGGNF